MTGHRALILFGLALCLPSTCVSLVFMVLYTFVVLFALPFSELRLVGLALDLVE